MTDIRQRSSLARLSLLMILWGVSPQMLQTAEAESATRLEYSAQSGHEPSIEQGFTASNTGTAAVDKGVLRTTDDDARGDGRYYSLPARSTRLPDNSDLVLTFELRIERSSGSRTATAIELSLPMDAPRRGPFTTGVHGEGYQDILFEGRRISIGFLSDGVNHDRDEILLIDPTHVDEKGILARATVPLNQSQQYLFRISRGEPNPDDDLVSLSILPNAKLISVPLNRFQASPQAIPFGVVFGHPASPGLAVAEWKELSLQFEPSSQADVPHLAKTPVEIGTEHQLFVDDFLIEDQLHVVKEQGRPVKSPANPVLKREMPWEQSRCELYGSAIWNPEQKRVELFYSATRQPYDAKLSLAYSSDEGNSWTRPKLDVFPWEGGPTNIVWPGRYWSHGPCVLHDPHDPDASRRYKLFLTAAPVDHTKENPVDGPKGIDVAFSQDGIHWTAAAQNPVIRGFNSDTGNCVIWDEERKLYRAYVRIRCNVGRSVALTESPDFIHWSEPRTIYIPTDFDSVRHREYYGLSVTKIEGLYLGLVWIFPNTPESTKLQSDSPVTWPELVVSRDGEHWQRPFPGEAFVPLGDKGSFDSRQIRPASSFTVLDDRILLLYSGSPHAHVAGHLWDIGLATLRKDGFAALCASDQEGSVLTRPLILNSGALEIDAEIEPGGSIRAELVDPAGNVLQGYSKLECKPVTASQTSAKLQWKDHATLPKSTAHLRLVFNNAKIYSFHVAP